MPGDKERLQPTTPDYASVGTSTTQILPFRYVRAGATFINISDNFITLRLDGTASVDMYSGITLSPGGGTWTMDEYTLTNDKIYAKASGASSTLCIQEFINGAED
ncbi:hypothetical protein M0R04_10985 [Candidatus Dojkabacteria bacterium]|jgi:hypothetical protein|nr:hypothetical protein [Candidatus Dojkabacteria bacterium]